MIWCLAGKLKFKLVSYIHEVGISGISCDAVTLKCQHLYWTVCTVCVFKSWIKVIMYEVSGMFVCFFFSWLYCDRTRKSGRELGERKREWGWHAAKGGFKSRATVSRTHPLYKGCMLFQFDHTVLNIWIFSVCQTGEESNLWPVL